MKTFLAASYARALELASANVLSTLHTAPTARLLHLGCEDGSQTVKLGEKVGTKRLFGVELVDANIEQAKKRGIHVLKADLNGPLGFDTHSFDIIHASQVIEKLVDPDMFFSEVFRILKPSGQFVITTENGSSWHNIFATALGWQPFSLADVSRKKAGLGNPLALYRHKKPEVGYRSPRTIFSYRGMIEFMNLYGFKKIKAQGAGYYPLPACFGNLDVRHSHLLTLSAEKAARVTVGKPAAPAQINLPKPRQ